MPRPVHGNHRYVPALDGLRAVAVLLVIAYHLDVPGFDGGLLGVGVFFTLSGYLITLGLMSSKLRDGTFNLKTFWFRRFRRLMPAMLATVFAVVLLSAAFDTANFRTRFGEALSSVFYVNNWHNIFTGTSYFERFQGPGPLDHMWSLSIEEQFYLIWPLLLWVLVKVCRRPWLIATVTGVIALLSYLQMWAMAEPGVDFTRVYEGTDTRAGGLLIGAVLAIVVVARQHEGKTAHLPPIGASLLGAAGVAGIVALSMAVGEQDIFLYRGGMLLLNLATAAAILAVLTPGGPWAAIFGFEPLRWIGERSYGIYLWHMPIIYFMPDEWLRDAPLKSALVVLILSVAVASLSWSIFEDPIRRHGVIGPWRARHEQPLEAWRPVTLGATVTLVGLIAAGLPAALGADAGGAGGANPAMSLSPDAVKRAEKTETESVEDTEEDTETEEAEEEASWADTEAGTPMACGQVYHIGDSTSIGMFDPAQLPEGGKTASDRYLEAGASVVEPSVFGARATTQGWEGNGQVYPSAVTSVQELLNVGVGSDSCWVIATGVNDAANADAARSYGYDTTGEIEANIRTMVELLDGYRILWPTAATGSPSNAFYANENMDEFNRALRKVAAERKDMVVYDWAAEARAHTDWFLAGDEVHYNADGNDQRARRFAKALAAAFPKGVDTDDIPVDAEVTSDGPKKISE